MEMATKIQIDVIGKIEGTQFMKCKLYTNENIGAGLGHRDLDHRLYAVYQRRYG